MPAPASAKQPVISCQGVVKRFDGREVLSGVTLDVMRGETMVIMGGSGSGKSTMLRMMIGSFTPMKAPSASLARTSAASKKRP